MPAPLKYPCVNWVNGMKIKKDHFIQQENAFEDRIRDVAGCFLSSFSYGLLPTWTTDDTSFRIVTQISNHKFLNLSVFQIRALTQGGARIEFPGSANPTEFSVDLTDEIEAAKKENGIEYFIMLSINPFMKEPSGEFNAEEEPPRHPDARPSLKINLITKKLISREGVLPFSLLIGKIYILPDRMELSENYIPACMTVRSHIRLISFHSSLEKFYNQLEINLLSIIRKIREKSQESNLAGSVLNLSLGLLDFISINILRIRWQMADQPPVLLFENIASLARIMRNTIDCNTSVSKEELLNYFSNWSELKQSDFEKLLVRCINFEYEHNEISHHIEQFSEFISIISSLFAKLESLAYIGKKKETNIFVKEQTGKRSFLVD
jgi:hypothetical protein